MSKIIVRDHKGHVAPRPKRLHHMPPHRPEHVIRRPVPPLNGLAFHALYAETPRGYDPTGELGRLGLSHRSTDAPEQKIMF